MSDTERGGCDVVQQSSGGVVVGVEVVAADLVSTSVRPINRWSSGGSKTLPGFASLVKVPFSFPD
jgi:hypothetical protein